MTWSVPELQTELPLGMVVQEDSDGVFLRCLWCGVERVFSAAGATAEGIILTAKAHRALCTVRSWTERTAGAIHD